MGETEIDKKYKSLLPHREPMLLIDKLTKNCASEICYGNNVC